MRLLYETHMHTPLCRHAVGRPVEYAAMAWRRGLKGIIVTDHGPAPEGWIPSRQMTVAQFPIYLEMVAEARREWHGRLDVRLGVEQEYFPGIESFIENINRAAPFDYVLGSVHTPCREYRERFYTGDAIAYQRLHFDHLACCAETKLYDCLAHPDIVKNCFPSSWNLKLIMDDVCRSLDRIARTGIAMELNTSGVRKDVPEMNPGPVILKEMNLRKIPVVLGGDAHVSGQTGAHFEEALEMLEVAGYTYVSVFLQRRRTEIPIADAIASLQEHQIEEEAVHHGCRHGPDSVR